MFISIKFTETSISTTKTIHLKVIGSKFMFKMSTIHTNTCTQTTTPLCNRCRDDGVHGPAASTPSADVLTTHSHHGSVNGRLSLEGYPRRCSGRCSPADSNPTNWVATSLGVEIYRFSLQQGEMFMFVGERHDFIDVNITSPGTGYMWHKRSKFTSMISIHSQSCTPKIMNIRIHL